MTTRREFAFYMFAALAASGRAPAAEAPTLRSLQLVVPTAPGTQPDVIARWLVEPMAAGAGVPGVVLNRPGGAGAIAADAVLSAAPETGALLLGGLDHVAYSHVNNKRRPLDPFVDFVPAGTVNRDTWLLVTSRESGVATIDELVAASRRAPLNYPSVGEGSTPHLVSARLASRLGIEAAHVPYKESYLPDLIAGRMQFAVLPTPAAIGQVRAGRLRALASLTDERLPIVDGVPSIRELGWPDQVFVGGLFLFAPAALAGHSARINGWLVDAMMQPAIASRYREAGIETTALDLAQTKAAVEDRLRTVDAMRLTVLGRAR